MRSDHHVARRWSPWVGKPPPPAAAPVATELPPPVVSVKPWDRAARPVNHVLRLPFPQPVAASSLPISPLSGLQTQVRRRPIGLVLPRIMAATAVAPVMEGARPVRRSDFRYAPVKRRKRPERPTKPVVQAEKAQEPPQSRLAESMARALKDAQNARERAQQAIALSLSVSALRTEYRATLLDRQIQAEFAELALIEEMLLLELIE